MPMMETDFEAEPCKPRANTRGDRVVVAYAARGGMSRSVELAAETAREWRDAMNDALRAIGAE